MASYYSTRTAYNSFLINTVTITADAAIAEDERTLSITQTGTLFLIDASAAGTKLTIKLPSPIAAGMYFKFMWSTVSVREVNIQLQDNTDSFSGLIVRHTTAAPQYLDVSSDGTKDRLKYTRNTHAGSWVEAISDGSKWVVYGDHYGGDVDGVAYNGMEMVNDT
mgnify:FL=1